jgi:hypothetical protein
MYRAVADTNVVPHTHPIWKLKLPVKINFFHVVHNQGVTLQRQSSKKAMGREC